MNCNKKVELYGVLALSKVVDDLIFPNLIKILKREKIQDCLEFLSQDLNLRQVGQEIQQVEIQSLFGQKYMVNVGDNNIKRIINVLKKTKDHEFNEQNYSMDEYEEIKKNLKRKLQNFQNFQFILQPLMRDTYNVWVWVWVWVWV
ncbi:unnamed protein product (macronuclear) [Paramecium tetraurelia]|uniref:Uncharacterized protein n=1 Tax=Paramecium tetraurelia TaxID=5888 RepID=A0C0P1_PARTE|nr:uncharacterized protein GSPATT00033834001 [Paramecium tetraurelia]CAK64358.1 unnamed protein product [Paramecium tetraurelia]|eukprot:XP_001431756.1 hypothetical protein (macronuclear) [Paramecium tetraurelia strain d4-2]